MRLAALLLCGLLLSACPASETVVLVRQLRDTTGAVTIESGTQTQTLSAPLHTATHDGDRLRTSVSSQTDVREQFGPTLDALPAASQVYTVYFTTGSTALLPASSALVDRIVEEVARRRAVEVQVTGHTDRVGSLESNDQLSEQRAAAVRDLLSARGLHASLVRVVGRGEREPLVPTPDETPEPRNRRVEILIR
jgi:outer membrane protein OmpA-like peptidoglycan-associated protein